MSSPRPPGSFKIANQRRGLDYLVDPATQREHRIRRIVDSLQADLDQGGTARVRQILKNPRELYRIELELPDMSYQRTTILDRETLVALLEQADEQAIRDRFTIRSGS
jgi:hypothetical protein